jgi:hypothetical protein
MTGPNPCEGRYARRMRYPGENAAGRASGRRHNPSGRTTPPEGRPAAGGAGRTGGAGGAGRTGVTGGSGVTGVAGGAGGARAGGTAGSDASLFAPGYTGSRPPGGSQALAGGAWSGQARGAVGKGPVRGFPPAPGQPTPLYPPGQFTAWNRAPAAGENGYDPGLSGPLSGGWQADYPDPAGSPGASYANAGYAQAGYSDAGYADAGYSDAGYLDQGYPAAGYAGTGPTGPGYSALAVSDPAADVTNTQSWGVADDTAAGGGWGDLSAPAGHSPHADAPWHGAAEDPALPAALAGPALAGSALAGPALVGPGPGIGQFDGAADQAVTGPDQSVATGPNQPVADGPAGRPGTGPQRAATGPFDLATPAPFRRGATGPNPRAATAPGRGHPARGRGSRGRKRARGRGKLHALLICGAALIIVVVGGAGYFFLGRGHNSPAPAADAQRSRAAARPSADPSPSPSSLGQWGHIETRAMDPVPLTLAELFPASFANGTTTYTLTVQKAKVHCAGALSGSQLIAAVSHAGCTQAMRASYLSSDPKLMGTIGVLNLVTATAAERAGKAAGPSEFIAQLPAARGATKNLTQGTGFEAAEVKGHYLVLVWAEFANLRTPRTPLQRSELEQFISVLMQKTANVSLATRQVTGSPPP